MNTQRSTFTLVDLIGLVVVVFVLGTLASLLLPSVGGGVVSRRAMCLHNLKQLSMASLEHAARHDGFPGYRQKIGEQTFPWCMVVMPMLEQGDIYDTWVDPNTTRFNAPQVRIDVLICPSDPIKRSDRAHLSYIANAGMADDFNYNSANGGMPNVAAGAAPVTLAYLAKHDGAPHTLLLSENVQATYWHLPGWTDATMFWHRR